MNILIKHNQQEFRVIVTPIAHTNLKRYEIFHGDEKIRGDIEMPSPAYCSWALRQVRLAPHSRPAKRYGR